MACRCAPALLTLKAQIDKAYPNRDRASDGCCGDPAHAARKSDHNPTNGYAHALDIDEDIGPSLGPQPLILMVPLLLDDPRTKYVIYEARIYFPDGTSRAYTGVNAHAHHLHLSIKTTATHDTTAWQIGAAEEDDMFEQADKDRLANVEKVLARLESAVGISLPADKTIEQWFVEVEKRLKALEAKP